MRKLLDFTLHLQRKPSLFAKKAGRGDSLTMVILVVISELLAPSTMKLTMDSIYEDYVELYCYKSTVWFLVPLSYNMFIMLTCAWIGFITRKLPDNFNESWFIFISISTTLFAWVVFIPAYFTTYYAYLQPAILGFCMILNCFVTLVCQFLPIMYAVAFIPANRIKLSTTTQITIHPEA